MWDQPPVSFAIAAALGYLLGSVPFGLVIVRAAGLGDIRAIGSGNIGATNVLRTGRKDLAAATFLLDSGKAAAALLLARVLFHQDTGYGGVTAGYVAGAAAFLGHCFPVWLNFKGGKGVATFFGVLFAGLPVVGAACAALWVLTAILFRYSSLGALVAAAAAPAVAYVTNPGEWLAPVAFCTLLGVLIFVRHHANITRLLQGAEPKIGAGKAAKTASVEE
ncbi:MAG: glycerol-3-phosphate 1-O-acyltransferase PlsY [Hyphomonadaceae bacterium]|nr:glycerol-3-phosphate 1-O-acyltransferase PlsY [Hyphomonadaceae bacterium]